MMYGALLALVEILLRLNQPIFLGYLIRYFTQQNMSEEEINNFVPPKPVFLGQLVEFLIPSNGKITKLEAYFHACGVIGGSAINILFIHPYMMGIFHLSMKIRVACCSLVYRKSLKISLAALGDTTVGQVVNLLSNDVNRFDMAIVFLHYLWIGPLEILIITYLLWNDMGWSAIFGAFIMLLFIPMQACLGMLTASLRMKTAGRTDERVRQMNEIISGIEVIKMYAWETPFAHLVETARKLEIKSIRASSYIRGVILSFVMFTTRVAIFICVLSYVLMGNPITAEKVFVVTSFYNILRQTMTVFFPQGVAQFAEVSVSLQRLETFLLAEETRVKRPTSVDVNVIHFNAMKGLSIFNASATWVKNSAEPTLKDISLSVEPNKLIAVIGPVGAGKTSLLHMMLGELPVTSGYISVNGLMSYASQEPWLFAGSVRQNILFGQQFDRERYFEVVNVCSLERDFTLLPYGDKTIVGDKGISLSGGQRARINLARACYKNADIYLLDDPLSAVDAHVGRELFELCFKGYLRPKGCVLITHQIQYLKLVDNIIIMNNGRIEGRGTYHELYESGLNFAKILEESRNEEIIKDEKDMHPLEPIIRRISFSSTLHTPPSEMPTADPVEVAEMRAMGKVSGDVFLSYFKSGATGSVITFMFFMFILAQFLASSCDMWITQWINMEETKTAQKHGISVKNAWLTLSTMDSIFVYTALTAALIIVSLSRSFLFFTICMRASVNLHNTMFVSITRAKMWFFNNNSAGRILNRFSKDMGAIDELLPQATIDCLQMGLLLAGVIVIVGIINYWLLLPTAVAFVLFYTLRVIYIRTSRSVKRLEGITRSPVFSHLGASLRGLTTIRAFGAQEILEKEFDCHQDLHSSAWFLFIASSRTFGFWLDIICLIYISIVTLSFLIFDKMAFGGNVGLAITQCIGLTGMFQWGMRQSAEVENQMTSVERVLEYTKVEHEPAFDSTEDKKPSKAWPSEGNISFNSVFLRYDKHEKPVLKNLNFNILSSEKVGIVGRTGAGKSSMIAAMFRLAELDGQIMIDGIETSSIGLHDLRLKLSIIPQEPVLFSGTMRRNLDPFNNFQDVVLWQALEEVEMKDVVKNLVGGLNSKMCEGGSNFSVGQRQLVCLARAIVRNNKILVLDEATANVDPHYFFLVRTDNLIQSTIRRNFNNCTVLTIAHRLNTVMDSDRIMVMDAGTMVVSGNDIELGQACITEHVV
uniref:Uncharacterized protein n=1 Tax=Timema monikensis TaxID=170555 RepID=A0A7R9DXR3_9NEOP|nr:unnamed protein product [Timema monikensis]